MKRMNKKGFTIVELVIVIAVIAILAGVLIPTFSGITTRAQNSARLQEVRNSMMNYLAEQTTGTIAKDTKFYYFENLPKEDKSDVETYVFNYANGKLTDPEASSKVTIDYTAPTGDQPAKYTIKVGDAEAVSTVIASDNANILIVAPAAE